ncbi:MAG: hypothetical protein GY866_16530 [Proteobacteria bacterium]|nr:hypothetical protein [Pseudomonadota bacterium]
MKDTECDDDLQYSLEELMAKMPFEVESVSPDDVERLMKEIRKSLHLALHFPLAESVKDRIRERLEPGRNGKPDSMEETHDTHPSRS